mmetsp:Transcript_142817/g.249053  ORF Transcript_142817/g.249053 Transcript_142817/m.249053 type:complete len:379 (+) Transcript_142817:83-1219(+)
MSRIVLSSSSPAVVSQRMCQLLLTCPAAAMGGVRWKILVGMYEERYSSQLDVMRFGNSAVAAATMLLWSVSRLLNTEDVDNPLVAIEDAEALTPKPGSLATWPSIYKVLHEVILRNGTPDVVDERKATTGGKVPRAIPICQLKPLLQEHWHRDFDECESHFTEEGKPKKLKKMKDFVHALLSWRQYRAAWIADACIQQGEVDEVLKPSLEMVPSTKDDDWVLRFVPDIQTARPPVPCLVDDVDQNPCQRKVAELHSSDAVLRAPATPPWTQPMQEFDDFACEPPLFLWTPAVSTETPSSCETSSGCATPTSSCPDLAVAAVAESGTSSSQKTETGSAVKVSSTTPGTVAAHRPALPMGDRERIPSGMVQERRKLFQRG